MTGTAGDLIDAYLCHLRLVGRSDYTTREWGRVLAHADRELPFGLDAAQPIEIQAWLGRPGWSPATRTAYYTCLGSFYRWATNERDRWLKLDPMRDVVAPARPARGLPDPCTNGELARMLTEAAEPYRLWIVLAAYAGLRCLEVSRLDRTDVDEESVRVRLGKGNRPRTVPAHPLVWDAVRDLPPGPLVRLRSGARASGRYVSHRSNAYLHQQLGMVRMHLHRCRHWYATRALEACGDPRVVQELLGHASLATTAIYTQVSPARRTAAVAGLPALVGVPDRSAPADDRPPR